MPKERIGTDPAAMSLVDCRSYIRQLQQTVLRWQHYAADLQGLTRAEMLAKFKRKPLHP